MTEEQLYGFLEIEMPRDIIIIDDNERENEETGEKENEETGEKENEQIPDSPESPPGEEKNEEIPEIPESPPGANFSSALQQARHETFFYQEKSRKIKMEKQFWKRFANAIKKLYLSSAAEHKTKDAKYIVIQEELSDLQYSLSESEMLLARIQRKLKIVEEALEL